MGPRKCAQCGLVNFEKAEACRRCGVALEAPEPALSAENAGHVEARAGRGVGRRIVWIAGVTIGLIFCWSRSLLLTSEPVEGDRRQVVMQAIHRLEQAGFAREVLMLRNFANFRSTDNWWNEYLGHRDAYAATNFPLGVVTLYPTFFTVATDDTERAAILFHESQHLLGAGEDAALERTWREKQRFGWTADRYGQTQVWRNTIEWTEAAMPGLVR